MERTAAIKVSVGTALLVFVASAATLFWRHASPSKPRTFDARYTCPVLEMKGRERDRVSTLTDLAKAAMRAGDLDGADQLADELLAYSEVHAWNYGNAIFDGHSIRGLVSLERGDIARARAELLLSASTPGSPQLDSFGPGTALAQALLDRRERAVVLSFLERTRAFWSMGNELLAAWETRIAMNRDVWLGPNVCY